MTPAPPARAATATLDHLVVAASTLADGIDFIGHVTGVTPVPGGRHVAMGTHNALLRLGDRVYLEIIAIDPDGAKPARPRWFGLDRVALQSDLTERPRLVHWVARTDDIDAAAAACGIALGPVQAMARGDYRWRITIPDDGALPGNGVLPTLIQWDVAQHPAEGLPRSPVTLAQLAATHPDAATVRATLAALGLGEAIHVTYDGETRLAAMLRTPRGFVTLSS
ncbi:MAG: VOC family protein [Betaproteobacteria bacterium]